MSLAAAPRMIPLNQKWTSALQPLTVATVFAVAMLSTTPCFALDYQPFDWVPAPPNTNVVMGYYDYGGHDEFNNTITGTAKNNTHLESEIGVARYLHYSEVLGHPLVLDFVVPFGALTDGKVDGHRLGDASGIADPLASVGFWFINQPEKKRYVSAATFVSLPIGTYDKHRSLNLGSNRWQNDLQVDFTQGFLDRFTVDVSGDWIYYGNNNEAGTGNQRLSQDSTYGAYVWVTCDVTSQVRHAMPTTAQASISIGYAGTFGGAQTLAGARTGAKTDEQQIRLSYSQYFRPTWQGVLSISHDVSVTGGFKQDFGLFLRIAKVF